MALRLFATACAIPIGLTAGFMDCICIQSIATLTGEYRIGVPQPYGEHALTLALIHMTLCPSLFGAIEVVRWTHAKTGAFPILCVVGFELLVWKKYREL